ncbi:hypothetical protein LZ009_17750 [Ramlibacter sp. XY19]|uniref:hypothetical protein n=1 Tax=Ramlibacter paludis TaxID=2908000 RepID=UPI0023DB7ED7|nr:hypothetical protein [Ramlibacter paludis]MCG2594626.1 hypothetical protein [Ramlibacter paludis]
MSLFDWFAPRKKHEPAASVMPSSGLSRLDSTRPFNAPRQAGTAQPANKKQERMARRELLYAVVREAMVRAGVLSSTYKFKVLSLDTRGRQFMVMVDLAQGANSDTARLAEIEAMVAQGAKQRYDILVTAVYWRSNEHVAVGDPAPRVQQPAAPAPQAPQAQPRAQRPAVSRPAELHAATGPAPEEVIAFKRALAASTRGEAALATANPTGKQSYTLLTGFEDTEMASGGQDSQLSGTQYGELR